MFEFHKFPLTKPLADKFRENVSGSKDGRPEWVNTIALGSGPGLFGPGSAVWQVHGCIATLVGGVRALLLQAAHPAPLSGVAEHSRYETDSFLKAHLALGYSIDQGAGAYIAQWSKSALPLGLTNAPMSVAELEATLDDFRKNDLATVARTAEVVRFILNPPFEGAGKYFYKVIANAAIATLNHNELTLLGLKKKSKIWLGISRVCLDIFLAILGPEPPAMQVARERINKSN